MSTNGHRATDVAVVGVRAAYGRIEVLHGVDLHVAGGSVFALLGPNGAGKSTLLKVINGRLRHTDGVVDIDEVPASPWTPEALARAGVVAIPEGRGVFPNLTVRDNLRMWTYRGGISTAEVEARAYEQFPRLKERRRQLAGTLSGGEQQMLAISRALAGDTKVLLLDEISMGLAPIVVGHLYELVAAIAAGGVTVVLVEQFAETALGIADRRGHHAARPDRPRGHARRDGQRGRVGLPLTLPGQPSSASSTTTETTSAGIVTSSSTPPASTRSPRAASTAASADGGPPTVSRATRARMDRLCAVFSRRTAPSTSAATASTDVSAPGTRPDVGRLGPAGRVHRALPPPAPDLFGDEGQKGCEEPVQRRQRDGQRGPRRVGPVRVTLAVGARLDELDVVVAEGPEERLGQLEGARVVETVVGGGGRLDQRGQLREQRRVQWRVHRVEARAPGRSPSRPSANFDALRTLMASRRPIFITPVSSAVSVPGRPLQAQ